MIKITKIKIKIALHDSLLSYISIHISINTNWFIFCCLEHLHAFFFAGATTLANSLFQNRRTVDEGRPVRPARPYFSWARVQSLLTTTSYLTSHLLSIVGMSYREGARTNNLATRMTQVSSWWEESSELSRQDCLSTWRSVMSIIHHLFYELLI